MLVTRIGDIGWVGAMSRRVHQRRERFGGHLRRFASWDTEDTMRLVPVGDNVILKREDSQQRSAGGIVLPDTAQEKPARGRILAVGDGSTLANGSRGE
jgi:hypothetical protein